MHEFIQPTQYELLVSKRLKGQFGLIKMKDWCIIHFLSKTIGPYLPEVLISVNHSALRYWLKMQIACCCFQTKINHKLKTTDS